MKSALKIINWIKFALVALALSASLPVAGERMDEGTHDLIIGKLESALKSLPKKSRERTSVTLRLADLYADRARIQVINQKGEQKAGVADRSRAIQLYKDAIPALDLEHQGSALLQLGHLQSIQGLIKSATATFLKASDERRFDRLTTARARSKLGEFKFRSARFADAETDFAYALRHPELPGAGLITYRLAWCQLNQGKFALAKATLIRLIQTPELLTVENQSGVVFDQSFHDDLTKDLVLFLARGDVGQKEIDLLTDLSPEKLRRDNLYALANELERLGKKYSATLAWAAYDLEGTSSPGDSVEKQIRVAQLQWDMGRKDGALEEFSKATELWRKKGCKSDKCTELHKRFKNFVINWHKTEKDRPSRQCLASYELYLKAFNEDAEMYFKAATVAEQTKAPQDAARLFAQAAILASRNKDKNDKANNELLEASLLKQIEAAETSKDKKTRLEAYENYLTLTRGGPKTLEVRYQKAQVIYEMGKNQDAFEQFYAIATEKRKDQRALRLKAADLSLDALASQKKDREIFSTSAELIKFYPDRESEFLKIHRAAAIQMAAAALNDKSSSLSDLRDHNVRLTNLNLKKASLKEKVLIFKNRITLSERAQDLSQVNLAAEALMRLRGISAADKEFALGRLTWVAELRLDFKTALILSRQMKMSNLSREDRHLRLAMLSDLAGNNPTAEYKAALKATRNREKALGIRATLVRLAKNPWAAINEHKSQLLKKPELLSSLVIEAYAKTGNEAAAKKVLRSPALKKSALAGLFNTSQSLIQWREADRRIARHQLYSGTDAILQKSITKRVALLAEQDKLAARAVKKTDWLAQLASLMTIERENRRLYNELLRLPVPRKLQKAQIERYKAMLSEQAEAFKIKADQAGRKANEFWNNKKAFQEFASAYREADGHTRDLLKRNFKLVAKAADRSGKNRIDEILDEKNKKPSSLELAKAQAHLKSNPFDLNQISEVKKLAEKRGEITMVAYLDARLAQLRKEVKQ